jgi:hypothetical protein
MIIEGIFANENPPQVPKYDHVVETAARQSR